MSEKRKEKRAMQSDRKQMWVVAISAAVTFVLAAVVAYAFTVGKWV